MTQARVTLDTVDLNDKRFTRWRDRHGVSATVIAQHGPGGEWPEVEYRGNYDELVEMIALWWDDEDLISFIDSTYVKEEPFFVQTDKRTEHFATKDAAKAFMQLHCVPWRKDNNAERIARTNAID